MIDNSPVSATLKLEMSLTLPAEVSEDRQGRSRRDCRVPHHHLSHHHARHPARRCRHGRRQQGERPPPAGSRPDRHRFQLVLRGGAVRRCRAHADTRGLGATRRRSILNSDWVDISDGDRGFCLINKGLPEYELYKDRPGTLAMTLLRCVGSISSGRDAPGGDATPEAQCLGQHTFEYAFYPHGADWQQAQVWKQAHQHNIPMVCAQTGAHAGDLPPRHSFIETSHPELILSAIKKAEDSDLLVVRVYNTTKRNIEQSPDTRRRYKGAKLLNLNEETIGEVSFTDETVTLDVGAKKIVTLGFER